jgi:enoyl-CoA hydratase/carnithine racemase
MTQQDNNHLDIEDRGATFIVRVDGGPHSLFGVDIADELDELVDRVDRDPSVHAVVFTGARLADLSAMPTSGGCKKGGL